MAILVESVTTCTNPFICYHPERFSADKFFHCGGCYIYKLNVQQAFLSGLFDNFPCDMLENINDIRDSAITRLFGIILKNFWCSFRGRMYESIAC